MKNLKQTIWKIVKWFFVSIGVLTVSLILLVAGVYAYYEWFWQEWSPSRIERITGVRVPRYDIIEYHKGTTNFTREYEDVYEIEFKRMPSDEMFNQIDDFIETDKTSWSREGKDYYFSVVWGNGIQAPKGEREEEDRMFSIKMTRGEKTARITSGVW